MKLEVLGARHADTITFMAKITFNWFEQGRYKEVEPLAVQVLEFGRKVLGVTQPDTVSAMAEVAVIRPDQGRYDELESLQSQVLLLRKQCSGEEHPDTIAAAISLASALRGLDRLEDARLLSSRFFELITKAHWRRTPKHHKSTGKFGSQMPMFGTI